MIYRIFGGIALLLLGLQMFPQFGAIPSILVAVLLCIAGVALLVGV
jgi:hypothetical protein